MTFLEHFTSHPCLWIFVHFAVVSGFIENPILVLLFNLWFRISKEIPVEPWLYFTSFISIFKEDNSTIVPDPVCNCIFHRAMLMKDVIREFKSITTHSCYDNFPFGWPLTYSPYPVVPSVSFKAAKEVTRVRTDILNLMDHYRNLEEHHSWSSQQVRDLSKVLCHRQAQCISSDLHHRCFRLYRTSLHKFQIRIFRA